MKTHRTSTRVPRLLSLVALSVVISASLMLSACRSEEEPEPVEEAPLVEEEAPGMAELEGNPSEYIGRTVSVDGEVAEVYGSNVFVISGGLLEGELPVIMPSQLSMNEITNGDQVRVTGTVQSFALSEMETQYNFELGPEFESEFEDGDAVLVADSVTPQEGSLQGRPGAPGDVPEGESEGAVQEEESAY